VTPWWWGWGDLVLDTHIQCFDLSEGPVYQAAGLVPGQVLNQFSMSEHGGFLRVATSERAWRADAGGENSVYTVAEGETAGLEIVDQVRGIGPRGFTRDVTIKVGNQNGRRPAGVRSI
jgi:uncharacterized secreted protein with C-terminal beta-propeller domain